MRLPDEVQKCVVFLGVKKADTITGREYIDYGGTGFFMLAPSRMDRDAGFVYLVTARHVAKEIEHGTFYIRANTKDGRAETIEVDAGVEAHWFYHPTDDTVDVAVMQWLPPQTVDYLCIGPTLYLTPEKIETKGIGVGDEIYMTWLFSRVRTGSTRWRKRCASTFAVSSKGSWKRS